MVEIIKVKWGVSNYYPNPERIELNEYLFKPEFKNLKNRIISHELEHSKSKSWIANRKVDALTKIKFKDLLPFYKKHQKCFFQQNFPITYSKKQNTIFFEWSLILVYLLIGGTIIGIYEFISFFSATPQMFYKILKYIGILIGIMITLFLLKIYFKKKTSEIDWSKDEPKLNKIQKKLKKAGINPEMWDLKCFF